MNGDGFADIIVGTEGLSIESVGAAYVYLGSAAGISTVPTRLAGPGSVVASAGDVNGDGYGDIVVGSPGTALLYLGGPAGVAMTPIALTNPSGVDGNFGVSVAGAGDMNGDGYSDVIVGADDAEAAYVYFGGSDGVSTMPATLTGPNDPESFTAFGLFVAGAGDVNGDGFADVVVASEDTDVAYVFLGSMEGPSRIPVSFTDGTSYFSVAGAGDVNGDGFADIVLGSDGGSAAFVNLGGATGVSTPPILLAAPMGIGFYFAYSVASAGDVPNERRTRTSFLPARGRT